MFNLQNYNSCVACNENFGCDDPTKFMIFLSYNPDGTGYYLNKNVLYIKDIIYNNFFMKGIVKKCSYFFSGCDVCLSKANCTNCLTNYLAFDGNKDGQIESCFCDVSEGYYLGDCNNENILNCCMECCDTWLNSRLCDSVKINACEENYFLYDRDSNGLYDTCDYCEVNIGCDRKNIIFSEFITDGTGQKHNSI